ncbi:MAG: tetratricopeptide repeat protein [candidate division WOR-3 bacterium]|nr:MAG: tetratricopeptide repeat protein [candidate division WOR-3 bacterium]
MIDDTSYIDELSGCYNRQYLKDRKEEELQGLVTEGIPFSVVMIDIDNFKDISEKHGNTKGEEIIQQFSRFLRRTLRTSDTVVRYGDDEFVGIMPHASRKDTEAVLWRMIKDCEDREFSGLKITVSVGIASFPEDGRTLVKLLQVAEEALTQARRSRKTRVGTVKRKRVVLPTRIFVDRTQEKMSLEGFLSDAENKIGVAVVTGRNGIGKTRLVREVLNDVHGYEVIWSNCVHDSERIAYRCIREAIRYRLRRRGMDLLKAIPLSNQTEIAKLLPEVSEHIQAEVKGVTRVLDKYRLYESIIKIFEIGENKKIYVFDDVQWIDKESMEVIKHVFDTIQDSFLRAVFIYRIEDVSSEVRDFIAYMGRGRRVGEFMLGPLGYEDIRMAVASIIDDDPEDRLTAYVVRESGGNPLFIEEIMRALFEGKYISDLEGFWRFREPEEELVPKAVEEIASSKYDSVSADAQHIVEIASIIGWFDVPLLMTLTENSESHILELFDELRGAGMLRLSDDKYEFVEDMCRDFVYKKIRGIRSIQLHRKICRHLEQEGEVRDTCENLAYHAYRGMDKDKGVQYSIMAGEKACKEYANRDAIRYFGWALELLFDEHSIEHIKSRIDCHVRRASVYMLIGEHENALKNVVDGLQLARAMNERQREGILLCIQAQIYRNMGQYNKTLTLAGESVDIFKKLNDPHLAECINLMGDAHQFHGEYDKAMQCYEEALGMHHRKHNRNGVAQVINNIGMVHLNKGDLTNALKYFKDALVIINETGHRQFEAIITGNIGSIMNELGNHRVALQYFEDALKILRKIGFRVSEGYYLGQSGWACIYLGLYDQAEEYFNQAVKIFKETSNNTMEGVHLDALGRVYYDRGEFDKASYYYRTAQMVLQDRGMKRHYFNNMLNRAYLSIEMKDMDNAKALIDASMAVSEELRSTDMKGRALMVFCEWSLLCGNIESAKQSLIQLRKSVEHGKSSFVVNMIRLLWGRYYGAIGSYHDAHTYLEKALHDCLELDEKFMVAKVQYYLGDVCIVQGNQKLGTEYIHKAMEIFTTIGAKSWMRKTEEMLGSLK